MPTVLVTGANRGLGLEFARQYATDGWTVYATARKPQEAAELAACGPDLSIHPLDLMDSGSIHRLAADLKGKPLDLVLANAGVIGSREMLVTGVDGPLFHETFQVNTIAPLELAGALLPNLRLGQMKKLVCVSSRLGSIGFNATGGQYPYRASKAALNMVWKSLSVDYAKDDIIAVTLSPGWVRTDMGGEGAPLDPETSVSNMRRVIDRLTPAENGKFFEHTGDELPW